MSDEVPTPEVPMSQDPSARSILQEQIKNLTTQVTELRELNTEAYKSLEERDARISTLEAKPESTARIAELEASIRDRNHFDKFAELAGAAKAKAKALRQLWRDAKDRGYEADGDEADEKALQADRGKAQDRSGLCVRRRRGWHHHGSQGGRKAHQPDQVRTGNAR